MSGGRASGAYREAPASGERSAARDVVRVEHIRDMLCAVGLDAIACALPINVLLITGYWPVVGTAIAIATREGRIALLAPEDELALAEHGWAHELLTFSPGSLTELRRAGDAAREPLARAMAALGLSNARARIGHEVGECFEPATYAALHLYGSSLAALLSLASPRATLVPADDVLAQLRGVKTPPEVDSIARACRAAEGAFVSRAPAVRPGLTELDVAAAFRVPLSTGVSGATRADGFTFCMSGPDSAQAFGAYARSRERRIAPGDLVLVHCNSYVDGYWTDITRTYCIGEPRAGQRDMYESVLEARAAALAAIRPGALGRDVDAAAREVLRQRGYGDAFKHSTGHGVGFAAIDHHAHPRLHPCSDDRLEVGMVFNVEPAIYIDGVGGTRHCDMVALGDAGLRVLTPFHATIEDLVLA